MTSLTLPNPAASAAPQTGQPVQYFIVANPSSKATVNPTHLLYNSGLFTPEEAKVLFDKLPTSSPISALPLKKVQPGSAAPASSAPSTAPATTPPASPQ